MATPWLEGLNPAQCRAVTHGSGPLLIVAGAGTGKTKTLACRVAHLIHGGVPAERILLLTFTRRAADEMISRAVKLVGESARGRVWGGTFHAVANRLLRIYGRALNLSPDFTVMDESDAADLMNLVRGDLGLAGKDRRFPRKDTLVKIYSHTINSQKPLSETVEKHFPWCRDDMEAMREVFEAYGRRKRDQSLLDYDDLLLFWSALGMVSGIGDRVADQFDHILVDEYQDTNAVQSEILRGMRRRNSNITVVGDDAQSIYSFRAATIRNILDFPSQFPGTTIVTLEQNYRSTRPILAASNAVMAFARERYTKELWSERKSDQKPALVTCVDETDQTEAVCRNILEHFERGIPLMRQAVLFRAGHHSASLEIELARRNIPFHKYGGLKFVEAAHIKDLLAFLRLLQNQFDEISWFRVLLMLEGVGPKTARRIMDELHVRQSADADVARSMGAEGEEPSLARSSPLTRLFRGAFELSAPVEKQLHGLGDALAYCHDSSLGRIEPQRPAATRSIRKKKHDGQEIHGKEVEVVRQLPGPEGDSPRHDEIDAPRSGEPPLVLQVERIRKFYEPLFERIYENSSVRARDLDQLAQIATRYRSRARFIADLTLDPPRATSDLAGPPYLEEDYLILSTIHSAKGCEWDVVHILHAADGMIPSDMATGDDAGIDEERRLFYVAMTRAKDMLYIYFPLRYYHRRFGFGDDHNLAQLTRFLPHSVRSLFVQRVASVAETDDASIARLENADPLARVNRLLSG